jgi:hypothetical protein
MEGESVIATLRKVFRMLAFVYLLAPVVIFFVGWVKPVIGLIALVCLIFLFAHDVSRETLRKFFRLRAHQPQVVVGICVIPALIAVLWSTASPANPAVAHNSDWGKHLWIMRELVLREWPVVFSSNHMLTYYIGFYLIPAIWGKAFGLHAAVVALFVWVCVGIYIFFGYLKTVLKPRLVIFPFLFFLFFSGLDVLAFVLSSGTLRINYHLENWPWIGGYIVEYSSNTTLLFWVPQHAIAGWIGGLMLYDRWLHSEIKLWRIFTVWTATLLWSPFVFLGLTPFLILVTLKNQCEAYRIPKYSLGLKIISLSIMVLILSLYLASVEPSKFPSGFIWQKQLDVWLVALFYATEVIIFLPFVFTQKNEHRVWFWVGFLVLALLPLYRFGQNNDLVMRASIPALLMMFIAALNFVESPTISRKYKVATVLIMLFLGASIFTYSKHALAVQRFNILVNQSGSAHVQQYIGSRHSSFGRLFMK